MSIMNVLYTSLYKMYICCNIHTNKYSIYTRAYMILCICRIYLYAYTIYIYRHINKLNMHMKLGIFVLECSVTY